MRKIVISGAGVGTGNLGVDALRLSVMDAIRRRIPETGFVILGHPVSQLANDGHREARYDHVVSAPLSFKLYRKDNLVWLYYGMRTGLRLHAGVDLVRGAVCACDISGGDSFTDLYGWKVFAAQILRKRMCLDGGVPLVLLPQTYGPFVSPLSRRIATGVVRSATMCWARDQHSFSILRGLLGDSFDPLRHRCGVDVAFALGTHPPSDEMSQPLAGWIAGERSGGGPLVGVNVSGLIYNNPTAARARYGFRADYREAMLRIVKRLIENDARVVLVPHVAAAQGHVESDLRAAKQVLSGLSGIERASTAIAPEPTDPRIAKWIISKCDWFVGTRMHAMIGALSSGVPTAAVAYSDKTLGVFESCGQGEHVHDPRILEVEPLVERVVWSYARRDLARVSLGTFVPRVISQAESQMDEIVRVVREFADTNGH